MAGLGPASDKCWPKGPALSTTTGRLVYCLGCAVSIPPFLLSQLLRGGPSAASAVQCLSLLPCSLNYYGEGPGGPSTASAVPYLSLPPCSLNYYGELRLLGCAVSIPPSLLSQLLRGGPSAASAVQCLSLPPCSLSYYGEGRLRPRLCRACPSLPALSTTTGRAVCGLGCAVSARPSLLSQLLR